VGPRAGVDIVEDKNDLVCPLPVQLPVTNRYVMLLLFTDARLNQKCCTKRKTVLFMLTSRKSFVCLGVTYCSAAGTR